MMGTKRISLLPPCHGWQPMHFTILMERLMHAHLALLAVHDDAAKEATPLFNKGTLYIIVEELKNK
jgi:hypothetical protein